MAFKKKKKSKDPKACLYNLFLGQGSFSDCSCFASDPKGQSLRFPLSCASQSRILNIDTSQGRCGSSSCCLHTSCLSSGTQRCVRNPGNPAKSIFNPNTQNGKPEGLLKFGGLSRNSKIKGLTKTSFSPEACTNLLWKEHSRRPSGF